MDDLLHLESENRFVIRRGAAEAVLKYALGLDANGTTVDFYSTFVPPECRGTGVAEKLVRGGLEWARIKGYSVSASCWYVAKFIR